MGKLDDETMERSRDRVVLWGRFISAAVLPIAALLGAAAFIWTKDARFGWLAVLFAVVAAVVGYVCWWHFREASWSSTENPHAP